MDTFDGKVAAVLGGGSAVGKEELASGHLAKVEVSGVVDDPAAVCIFVINAYIHCNNLNLIFYFSKGI